MNEYMASGWVNGVMDELTTLNRRFIKVDGYEPIGVHEYRMGLSAAADKLIMLNGKLLISAEKEEVA